MTYTILELEAACGTEIRWSHVNNRNYKGLLLSIDYDTMWLVVQEGPKAQSYYVDPDLVYEAPYIDKLRNNKLFLLVSK